MTSQTLRISEIFCSLQGETKTVGLPTVFIRLTGCPLRCQYCDTAYAFKGGHMMTLDDILMQVNDYKTRHVTVTGGEPLAQKACLPLLDQLVAHGYEVSLETSGALSILGVNTKVMRVVDIKTPDSQESDKNDFGNLTLLTPKDQLKFVICSRSDYEWSKQLLEERSLQDICEVLFSPSYEDLEPRKLANWIIEDKLPVRFQIQLHKVLWGDKPGV